MTSAPRPSPVPPLSEQHLAILRGASAGAKTVRRARAIALVNAWTLAIFGAITALGVVFSPAALPIAAALALFAIIEFRGARGLGGYEPGAARLLMWNQLALGFVVLAYASWKLFHGLTAPSVDVDPMLARLDPSALAMAEGLRRTVIIAVYGTLAVVGPLLPGLTAWYYATRRGHIERLRRDTPEWAFDALRAAA